MTTVGQAVVVLERMRACDSALTWLRGLDPEMPVQQAWELCDRGDWMMWLWGLLSGPPESEGRRRLALCACAVARTALVHVPEGELRPLRRIETAERWARGEAAVDDEANAAWAAAAEAAYDSSYAARYAADAASCAASTSDAIDVTAAASDAFYTSTYASYASYSYASTTARAKALSIHADIVRQHYPHPPEL
jgi:hypothetical protein